MGEHSGWPLHSVRPSCADGGWCGVEWCVCAMRDRVMLCLCVCTVGHRRRRKIYGRPKVDTVLYAACTGDRR